MFFNRKNAKENTKGTANQEYSYRMIGVTESQLPFFGTPAYEELANKYPGIIEAVYGHSICNKAITAVLAKIWYLYERNSVQDIDLETATESRRNVYRKMYGVTNTQEYYDYKYKNAAQFTMPIMGYSWEYIDTLTFIAVAIYSYNWTHGSNLTLRSLVEAYLEQINTQSLETLYNISRNQTTLREGEADDIEKINTLMNGYSEYTEFLLKELDFIWQDSYGFANMLRLNGADIANLDMNSFSGEDSRAIRILPFIPRQRYTRRFGNDKYLMAQEYFKKQYEWASDEDVSRYFEGAEACVAAN